jgi:fumarate hydratase subunit alpha
LRKIDVLLIEKEIEKMFIEANYILPQDIKTKLNEVYNIEDLSTAKNMLEILIENYKKSEEMVYPLCQDTGMAVVFLEIGQNIEFINGYIIDSVHRGVENAYKSGYLRKSVVKDPLRRINTNNNLPPIVHTEIIKGDEIKISIIPKGFGAENQSKLQMMSPSAGSDEIIDFIVNGVIQTGGRGCPPCVIGVGIGGDFEYCAVLSKKALLIPIDKPNPDPYYSAMETQILDKINSSSIGIQGIGGKTTCLSVKILTYPTHIAGLPVAYNYCCHSARHKTVII